MNISNETNTTNTESVDSVFDSEPKSQSSSLADVFNRLIEKLEFKLSFDEYLEMLGEQIDRDILATLDADKGKKHYGGYIYFKISDDKKYLLFKISNYYMVDEQWYNSESKGKTKISRFRPEESKLTLQEIYKAQQAGEEYKLDISTPDRPTT